MTGTRLHASLFVAVADVFLGASGIILALIVLSSAADEPRARRQAQTQAICIWTQDSEWKLSTIGKDGTTSAPMEIATFITFVTTNQLLNRVALQVGPAQMPCFKEIAIQARKHNRSLLERGAVSGSLTIGFVPNGGKMIKHGE